MDTLPEYIVMSPLHGSFIATAPQTKQREAEEGMVAMKLNLGTKGATWREATFSVL